MSEGCKKGVNYTEIMCFDLYFPHSVFNLEQDGSREKVIQDYLTIRLVINLEWGDILN